MVKVAAFCDAGKVQRLSVCRVLGASARGACAPSGWERGQPGYLESGWCPSQKRAQMDLYQDKNSDLRAFRNLEAQNNQSKPSKRRPKRNKMECKGEVCVCVGPGKVVQEESDQREAQVGGRGEGGGRWMESDMPSDFRTGHHPIQ